MVQGKSIAFAAEFEPAVLMGARRSMRAPVSLDARIGRGGLDRALCRVVDLSRHGARIQTYSAVRQGSSIWLALPKAGHHAARVIWANDFEAGLEFMIPLADDVFEMLTE